MIRLSLIAFLVAALMLPAFAGGKDCEKNAAVMAAGKKGCPNNTQDCLNAMAAKLQKKGWVGIEYDKDEATGVMTVTRVVPGSPAEAAGFQKGDVLLAVNGVSLEEGSKEQMHRVKQSMVPGGQVAYTVKRAGQKRTLDVTLAKVPEDVMAQWIGSHMLEHATVAVAQK
jgi:predicted metalloprotease with PDZ domain